MSRSLLLVAVPVGVLGLLAVMIGGSRSSTSAAQSTTTTTTATIASPSTAIPATASSAQATSGANNPPASTSSTAPSTTPASTNGKSADGDFRAPSAPKPGGEAIPGTSEKNETPTTRSAETESAAGGFGVVASAPSLAASVASAGAPNRTWHRADELKLTIGSDTVDVTAPSAFHTGADVPVLHVGGKRHASSSFVTPNVIRFTGVGTVAPGDEIAISYGKGAPTVLRRGASR